MPAAALSLPPWLRSAGAAVVGATACFLVAVVVMSRWDPSAATGIPIAVAGAVAAWLVGTRRTELALAFLLAYLALGDGPAKLMTNSFAFSLVRDAVLLLIVVGVVARLIVERRSVTFPPLTPWVVGLVLLTLVQAFNPNNVDALSTLGGIRQQLQWVPLFFLGYAVLRTSDRLRAFLVLLVAVAAANAAFGVVQFGMSLDQLASLGPGYRDRVFGTGDVGGGRFFVTSDDAAAVRPFGFGPDSGFPALIGMLALPAAIVLVIQTHRLRHRLLALAGVGLVVAGIVTAQTRAGLIGAAVTLVAFLLLAVATSPRRGTLLAGTAVALVVAGLATSAATEGGEFRSLETITPSNLLETTRAERGQSLRVVSVYVRDTPFGAGIGRTGPASILLPDGVPVLNGESQFNYLAAELGVAGLVLFVLLTGRLLVGAWTLLPRVADPAARLRLVACAAPLFGISVLWLTVAVTAATPGGPYFWFIAGVLAFWLPFKARGRRPAARTR